MCVLTFAIQIYIEYPHGGPLLPTPLPTAVNPLHAERTSVGSRAPQGMVDVFEGIVRDEGMKGLYRGLLPNFLKVIPAVSTGYVVYEQIKLLLGVTTIK